MIEKWRGWNELGHIDDLRIMYPWAGVYWIRLVGSTGRAIPIGRFLETDETGTLQLGVSQNLAVRLYDFYRSAIDGRNTHSEGTRLFLARLISGFETRVHVDASIQFNTKRIPDLKAAEKEEERLIKHYFRRFGEPPPLNSVLEDQVISWRSIETRDDDPW